VTKFFSCGALKIVVVGAVFDNLAVRIPVVIKEAGERNPWGSCLLPIQCLLFLPFVTLSFSLLAFRG